MKHRYLNLKFVGLCLLAMLSLQIAWAQQAITGKVTDAGSGEGLPGVNILVKGTTTGAVTDLDGNFSLNAASTDVLVVSSVGYLSQEIPVGTRSVINVSLAEDVQSLAEVVVVGYGTQEKKEITSSVASIDAESFNQGNVNDPAQLLQGKVAGLSIARPGGDPNGGFNIRLRGLSTLGANTEPLIVIDGVIGASLQSVDPNDIASIDILKDGSAAAIYGTRGSSGVILITTKQGKEGRTNVDYNGYVSTDWIAAEQEVLSADQFVAAGGVQVSGANTDWVDEVTRSPVTNVHNLALSGGTSSTTYRLSFNIRDGEGIARDNSFTQLNGRLNLTQRAFDDKLTLTANLAATTRNQENAFAEAFRYATLFNPTAPIRVVEGNASGLNPDDFTRFGGYYQEARFEYFNPVAIQDQTTEEEKKKQVNINLRAEYDFSSVVEGLRGSVFYAQQRESTLGGGYISKESQFNGIGPNGLAGRGTEDKFNQLFEATATYDHTFGDLDMSVLGGYSWQEFEEESFFATGGNFLTDAFSFNNLGAALDFANGLGNVGSFKGQNELIAFFGRVNFNYQGTYFLSASYRREGSTRFGENNKWGDFPAVSAGVNLSNLFDIPGVDELKLRASYGVTGNQPSFNNLSTSIVGPVGNFFVNGSFVPSFGPVSNANPDLKWERKKEIDIGVDFSLLEGRLNGSIDWYTRDTEDLLRLTEVPVPPNLFGFTWLNVGALENTGLELAMSYLAVSNDKLTWEPSITFSTFSTELTSLERDDAQFISNLGAPGLNGTFLIRVAPGEEVGQIWGPVTGADPVNEDGSWNFQDLDGDGTYCGCDDDATVIGNGLPDFEIGFNNSFTFGNWDFNMFWRGSFGHDLVNTYRVFYEPPSVISQFNILQSSSNLAGLTDAPEFSSYQVEDASFFKLDNATLGYAVTLPEGSAFNRLRFYVSVQNPIVFTGYEGVDPEVRFADPGDSGNGGDPPREDNPDPLAPGIDRRTTYFRTASATFGINLGF